MFRARLPFLLFILAAAFGQSPEPRFEVASIKPSMSPAQLRAQRLPLPANASDPSRMQAYGPLGPLIRRAYRMEPFQQLNGPDFLNTAWFEITAKLPEGGKQEQIPEMLRALLVERFGLVVRRESKEESVYFLTVSKDGPKLKEADTDAGPNSPWLAGQGVILVRTMQEHGWLVYNQAETHIMMTANKVSTHELANALRSQVDAPVIDHTGLTGLYQFSIPVPATRLTTAMRRTTDQAGGEASEPSGVNVMQSIGMLGLRLEKGRSPIETVIVEHIEKSPKEN